jgi:hypothetical protein
LDRGSRRCSERCGTHSQARPRSPQPLASAEHSLHVEAGVDHHHVGAQSWQRLAGRAAAQRSADGPKWHPLSVGLHVRSAPINERARAGGPTGVTADSFETGDHGSSGTTTLPNVERREILLAIAGRRCLQVRGVPARRTVKSRMTSQLGAHAVLRGRIEPDALQWIVGSASPWFILHARSAAGWRVCIPVLPRRRTAV